MPSKYVINFLFLLVICCGCSDLAEKELKQHKQRNTTSEAIYRRDADVLFKEPEVEHVVRPHYPWEKYPAGQYSPITKEYFRCRGSILHPPLENGALDCQGVKEHGLPLRDGKEFIYPILIDLLNYVQKNTEQRVVITSGHRCPIHNTYVQPKDTPKYSKHQIGAMATFYVEGYEEDMQPIIELVMEYYADDPEDAYRLFRKGEAKHTWINKEIVLQYHSPQEERNLDNRHPYPYISLEVRYDRTEKRNVRYDWKTAHQGYERH